MHISGKVTAGQRVYLGTNAYVIEEIDICDDVTIGAAACVSKDIVDSEFMWECPLKNWRRDMAGTIGSLIDKLATVNQKMFMAQEELYVVRKMNLQSSRRLSAPKKAYKNYIAILESIDLNVQRQAMDFRGG